jgi:amino-acid N-acetyltransferase
MLCQIEKLKRENLDEVKNLLKEAGLPNDDIDEHAETFIIAKTNDELIGVIGLEIWNYNALLRSLVVKAKYRNHGIANELYEKCIEMAKQNSINTVALLTTTAKKFFSKKGFVKVTGNDIPDFLKETKEFRFYCPNSSIIMTQRIDE